MKINDVFESIPRSVHDVISESGTCFHLPEYQRPYSWNKEKVSRLIDDIKAGSSILKDHDDAITFLGTLLTVDDYKGESLTPILKPEKPTKTRLVIDGQQRLTTLTLLCSKLYIRLNTYLSTLNELINDLDQNQDEEYLPALYNFIDQINSISSALRFFSKDTNSKMDKYNRYYPLLTRANDDVWSKMPKKAKYSSPVANYLHQINRISIEDNYPAVANIKINDETLTNNIKTIKNALDSIEEGYVFSDEKITGFSEIKLTNFIHETFLNLEIIEPHLSKNETVMKLAYLSIFSSYLLHRTCFTFVSVSNLDYAFDMFEALNTTGEPLTAS